MNFKRIICLMLVVMFALTALVSCGGNKGNNKDKDGETDNKPVESELNPGSDNKESENESTGSNDSESEDEGEDVESESKPSDSDTLATYNFNNAEFKILTRTATRYEFDDQNEKGLEGVNTAIYQRNESVKDRFNVKFRFEETNGSWDSDFVTVYQQKTMSGWSDVHLTSAHFAMQQLASIQNQCRDMTTIQTEDGAMDMTKAWWSKPFYENCNIEGKFYVAVGDITYTLYEYMQVMFFNEQLAEAYVKDAAGGQVDLYAMVDNYEWTYDEYKKFIKSVPYDETNQIRGLGTQAHAIRGYATAFEAYYTEADYSGEYIKYSFPDVAPQKISTVVDSVAEFMKSQLGTTIYFDTANYGANENELNQMFAEGKLLFYEQMLGEVVEFSKLIPVESDLTFGVLPLPLWSGDQFEYHTPIRDTASAISVPKNVENLTMSGVITEALCMYSYQYVRPEYLDTVFAGRYMSNENIQMVLDLVRETFTVDFAHAYSPCLGTPYSTMDAFVRSSTDKRFESYWATSYLGYQSRLEELYKNLGTSAN